MRGEIFVATVNFGVEMSLKVASVPIFLHASLFIVIFAPLNFNHFCISYEEVYLLCCVACGRLPAGGVVWRQ